MLPIVNDDDDDDIEMGVVVELIFGWINIWFKFEFGNNDDDVVVVVDDIDGDGGNIDGDGNNIDLLFKSLLFPFIIISWPFTISTMTTLMMMMVMEKM